MVLVSYSGKEINAKIVFYGPGLCGKTTNLEYIYGSIPSTSRGKMVSMKTKTERTLFFDFLPLNLGELAGFKTRFLLYTVPGQVYYNATRKLVLKGVDAVIFVADSQRGKMDENVESFQNLRENLQEHGLSLDEIPYVIQYNKRDLRDVYSIDELERVLNASGAPNFPAVATTGEGVFETFKACSKLLLAKLSQDIGAAIVGGSAGSPPTTSARGAAIAHQRPPAPAAPQPQKSLEAPIPAPTDSRVPERPRAVESTEHPAPSPGAQFATPPAEISDQRKTRGLWRWLRREETEEQPVGSAQAEPAEPEITWRPATQAEPLPAPREVRPEPPAPPASPVEPPELPVMRIESPVPKPARPESPAAREARPEQPELRPQPSVQRMEPSKPETVLDAGRTDEVPGIPGLERSPFAAMPTRRPRPGTADSVRSDPSGQRQLAKSGDPLAVEARRDPEPAVTERQTLRPLVADLSRPAEIIVPVIIPRSAIRDRVEIRLVLRIVQEMEVPGEQRNRAQGTDDLAASA